METPSPSKQSAGPLKGATKRKPIRDGFSSRASKQDTSTDTVLSSSAKITNSGNKEKSFNDTGEKRSSSGIEDEEEENDDDRGNDPEGFEDDKINQNFRSSVERETDHQNTSQFSINSSTPEKTKHRHKYAVGIMLAIVIAVLAVTIIVLWPRFVPKQESTNRQSCTHFLQLHSKYPNTDDMLWATLIVGVERAVNDPGEPATFIFLYNSSSVDQSLVNDVIHITIKCFGNGDAIWRTSNDFKSAEIIQDYGGVLDQHREELKSQGVLVVRDLDKVPPNAAQVFFTICDSYEPLVRKAVIFFTIDISQQANQSQLSPTSIAERILKDLWRKELHSNVLDPLVVRLTENVFKIE